MLSGVVVAHLTRTVRAHVGQPPAALRRLLQAPSGFTTVARAVPGRRERRITDRAERPPA